MAATTVPAIALRGVEKRVPRAERSRRVAAAREAVRHAALTPVYLSATARRALTAFSAVVVTDRPSTSPSV